MNLNGIMLNCEHPHELAQFYTKALGSPEHQDGDWYGYRLGSGYIMVGPHSEVKGQSQEPARVMISIESKDVTGDFEKFCTAGATVIAKPYQPDTTNNPKVWLATIADSDGNYLQLATPWEDAA